MKIEFNMAGWDELVRNIVDERLVPKALEVASACNAGLRADRRGSGPVLDDPGGDDEYVAGTVSIDGGDALTQHDYRATVITRTWEAMRDNAMHNRLTQNFHIAESRL